MEQLLADLPRAVLEISGLLALAVVVALLTRRINVPLTVLLAVAGLAVNQLAGDALTLKRMVTGEGFEQVLVNLFLPVLVFEAAYGLSTRRFLRNLAPIAGLATVAVVISAALVGVSLAWALGIPVVAALLFGVIISATDPVAVVAVFRELGVPARLLTLVEGESLLNDGVAIVLSSILVAAAVGSGDLSVGSGVVEFLAVMVGGVAVGAVVGGAAALLIRFLSRLPAAALTVAVAYGGFVATESLFGFSGVMATVTAGLILGGLAPSRAPANVRSLLHELWDSLTFIANALLFLLVGVAIDLDVLVDNWWAIGLASLAVLIARPLAVLPTVGLLEALANIPKVGARNASVLIWGGLRGGVALALAFALPADLPERELFVALTGGVVLVTLLVNATTMPWLVHRLGLDQPSDEDLFLDGLTRLIAVTGARRQLRAVDLGSDSVDDQLRSAENEARQCLADADLDSEDRIRILTMRGLHIEQDACLDMRDAGLLTPHSARALVSQFADEIDALDRQETTGDSSHSTRPTGRNPIDALEARWHTLNADTMREAAYEEIAARRLAAHRAVQELDNLGSYDEIDPGELTEAKEVFTTWEERASTALDMVDADNADEADLVARQAAAVARISAMAQLNRLTDDGIISETIAQRAATKLDRQVSPD